MSTSVSREVELNRMGRSQKKHLFSMETLFQALRIHKTDDLKQSGRLISTIIALEGLIQRNVDYVGPFGITGGN